MFAGTRKTSARTGCGRRAPDTTDRVRQQIRRLPGGATRLGQRRGLIEGSARRATAQEGKPTEANTAAMQRTQRPLYCAGHHFTRYVQHDYRSSWWNQKPL
jgi:hypothetical protein